jgi:hypothetical protein
MAVPKPRLTPTQVAEIWAVTPKKVYQMIDAGELQAIDTSLPGSKRKRWVICIEAIEAYEKRKSNLSAEARAQARRRVRTLADPYREILS